MADHPDATGLQGGRYVAAYEPTLEAAENPRYTGTPCLQLEEVLCRQWLKRDLSERTRLQTAFGPFGSQRRKTFFVHCEIRSDSSTINGSPGLAGTWYRVWGKGSSCVNTLPPLPAIFSATV